MKIKKRLNISDWEIIEDTPKLKRFGDGGSVEKNKKILKEKGILPEQEFKRNKYQESLSNNLKPIGYDYNSFVHALYEKNKGREVLENRAKDTDPYASNLIPKSRLDAFNFYMGKPQKYNTFDVSDYRPSKETDFKTNYYKLNYFQDYYAPDSNVTDLENLFKTKSLAETDLPFLFSKKEKQKVNAADAPVMANYTLSKGEDEKGKYYSYYDKWDIAPMDFGKPFEIYDRIYYDPSTNKIIPPKKPYIKKAPLPGQSVQVLEFKNGGSINKYPNGGREPIVVNDPRDERLHSYLDSLNLYNSYQTQLKYNPPQDVNKSLAAKYLKPGTEAYNNNVNARQIFNKNSPAKNAKYFKNVTSDYWNSEAQFKKDVPEDAPLIDAYKKLSFSTPTKTGLWTTPDLYNSSIAPVDIYFGGQKPESSAWNPIYKKPVQPYAYSGNSTDYEQYRSSPTIVGTNRIFKPVNNLPNTKTTSTLTSIPTIVKNRPKENITTLNQEQQLLPETNTQLEFDPIGLKKGTYFTRPRQQQEAGQGSIDYFDNKTGKLLKTMEFGGNITTESEWELVNETNKKLPKRRLNLNKSSDWEIVD